MYNDYANTAFRQLRDDLLRTVNSEELAECIVRAERLLNEIEPARVYKYTALCGCIADSCPNPSPDTTISGEAAQHDLRRLIEDWSDAANLRAADAGEPVHTVDELSKMFDVSTKTISRWREQGLVARRLLFEDRKRVAFLRSSVERFVAKNRNRVKRGQQFCHLSAQERATIVHRAREMGAANLTRGQIIKRIAAATGRSVETIRYTLKRHNKAHPGQEVFAHNARHLSKEAKEQIFTQYRLGTPVAALAKRYGRTGSSISRTINEIRAAQIVDLPLDSMHNDEFDDPLLEESILAPSADTARTRKATKPPSGLPPYLAALYETPLLTREQERQLFRKYNYLKYRADMLRRELDPLRPNAGLLNRIEQLYEEAVSTKNQIVQANLRLVVSLAKKRVNSADSLFDLISDGNMSLFRAVEKFDYARGNKFSTYATWAIIRNFARTIPEDFRRQGRFHTGQDQALAAKADFRANRVVEEAQQGARQRQVNRILHHLNEREQKIIIGRFGLDPGMEPKTLKEVGAELGVTKERIRQIEARAMNKLRVAAREEGIQLLN